VEGGLVGAEGVELGEDAGAGAGGEGPDVAEELEVEPLGAAGGHVGAGLAAVRGDPAEGTADTGHAGEVEEDDVGGSGEADVQR